MRSVPPVRIRRSPTLEAIRGAVADNGIMIMAIGSRLSADLIAE